MWGMPHSKFAAQCRPQFKQISEWGSCILFGHGQDEGGVSTSQFKNKIILPESLFLVAKSTTESSIQVNRNQLTDDSNDKTIRIISNKVGRWCCCWATLAKRCPSTCFISNTLAIQPHSYQRRPPHNDNTFVEVLICQGPYRLENRRSNWVVRSLSKEPGKTAIKKSKIVVCKVYSLRKCFADAAPWSFWICLLHGPMRFPRRLQSR